MYPPCLLLCPGHIPELQEPSESLPTRLTNSLQDARVPGSCKTLCFYLLALCPAGKVSPKVHVLEEQFLG